MNTHPTGDTWRPNSQLQICGKIFCKDETDVSYELYRRVFTEEKITFGEPSRDECDSCLEYTMHIEEVIENHDANECQKFILAKSHLETAKKPRHEYQKELPDNVSAYAVDMQKVIILPKLSTKESFFYQSPGCL